MTEEYGNALLSTRRQSRELDFHNWDNFDSEAEAIRVIQMVFDAEKKMVSAPSTIKQTAQTVAVTSVKKGTFYTRLPSIFKRSPLAAYNWFCERSQDLERIFNLPG